MSDDKIISGDTHIVELPDLYSSRLSGKLKERAPYMKRQKLADGKESDAWFLGDTQVVTLGAVTKRGAGLKIQKRSTSWACGRMYEKEPIDRAPCSQSWKSTVFGELSSNRAKDCSGSTLKIANCFQRSVRHTTTGLPNFAVRTQTD